LQRPGHARRGGREQQVESAKKSAQVAVKSFPVQQCIGYGGCAKRHAALNLGADVGVEHTGVLEESFAVNSSQSAQLERHKSVFTRALWPLRVVIDYVRASIAQPDGGLDGAD